MTYQRHSRRSVRSYLLAVALVFISICILVFLVAQIAELFSGFSFGQIQTAKIRKQASTPVARHETGLWDNHLWLNQTQALALRSEPDVINLTQLKKNGGVLYSATSSAVLNQESWVPLTTRPFGLTAMSIDGTQVSITAYQHDFELNLFQPFFLTDQPEMLYLVDASGQVWETEAANIVALEVAAFQLPIDLPVNSQLSLSY